MKVVIIDDSQSMLIILKKIFGKMSDIQVVGAFQSVNQAEDFLNENLVDVVFIDINMPKESGIDFAKRVLQERGSTEIVFITSHKEYALEAFEVYAFDYIVKPISMERLYKTINRIKDKKTLPDAASQKTEEKKYKLSICCLGRLDIYGIRGEIVRLPSSKSEELLAYLLMNRGKPVSKWKIVEDLFTEMPLYNAETYLNTTTYKLRKALEPYGLKDIIIYANKSYQIELKDMYVDFIEFENHVNRMSAINTSNIKDAIELENTFTAELFEEKGYYWALPERERLTTLYWNFAKILSKKLLEDGDYLLAIKILKKLEERDETDEEINSFLIQAYAAQKDKMAMMRQYKKYEEILRRELGIKPEVKFTALYKKLKDSV
ncbi:MAG: response regulator containing CheY-like receiver and domain [Clostridia bacterium]|jgi:two-component SAPR family response regulator|nr:response regulator containing CheY-like receiver and domain [Clostridia bacterium]